MAYGQAELYTLLSDSSVTALLTNSSFVYYDTRIPDDGAVVPGALDATINYYRISPVNGGMSYMQAEYSVNCRAKTMAEADAIARAVFDVVNRHSSGSIFFVCSVDATIPPADKTDNYNAPVSVIAKGRVI